MEDLNVRNLLILLREHELRIYGLQHTVAALAETLRKSGLGTDFLDSLRETQSTLQTKADHEERLAVIEQAIQLFSGENPQIH